jgi:hypothetical protein
MDPSCLSDWEMHWAMALAATHQITRTTMAASTLETGLQIPMVEEDSWAHLPAAREDLVDS